MNSQIIKPTDDAIREKNISIFLAGSIEMGVAKDWQTRLQEELKDFPITIYNPRRDSWDSSWEQRETNPQFNQQVNWEMNKLEDANLIFMYFSPETKSPISLLELGLHANDYKMVVVCPDGFWRKGNVEVVCSRFNIPLYNTLESGIASLKSKLQSILNN